MLDFIRTAGEEFLSNDIVAYLQKCLVYQLNCEYGVFTVVLVERSP